MIPAAQICVSATTHTCKHILRKDTGGGSTTPFSYTHSYLYIDQTEAEYIFWTLLAIRNNRKQLIEFDNTVISWQGLNRDQQIK